jgi:hypothetical protein
LEKLVDYFNFQLEVVGRIDVEPLYMGPTKRYNMVGNASVSKRLDIFLVSNQILHGVNYYIAWIDPRRCSDHNPIFLELGYNNLKPSAPFKYNPKWIEEEYFQTLAKGHWKYFDPHSGMTSSEQFAAS